MTEHLTQTETVEPEWIRTRREINGYLVSVNADTASDPEYIAARIQDALDSTAAMGARVRATLESRGLVGEQGVMLAEQKLIAEVLTEAMSKLVEELRPHSRAGDAAFAELQAAYPGLHWFRTQGLITASLLSWPEQPEGTFESCVAALGLIEKGPSGEGRTVWAGTYAGLPVRLFGTGVPA